MCCAHASRVEQKVPGQIITHLYEHGKACQKYFTYDQHVHQDPTHLHQYLG